MSWGIKVVGLKPDVIREVKSLWSASGTCVDRAIETLLEPYGDTVPVIVESSGHVSNGIGYADIKIQTVILALPIVQDPSDRGDG